jgi:hypothetical protein
MSHTAGSIDEGDNERRGQSEERSGEVKRVRMTDRAIGTVAGLINGSETPEPP